MTPRVVLGPSSFGDVDPSVRALIADAGFDLVDNPFKRKLTRDEIGGLLTPDVVGLIAGLEPLDRAVLEASRLKVVSRVGSGVSNVDLVAARDLGIAVRTTPDGPTSAVAELTLTGMLSLLRRFPEMNRELHAGRWPKTMGAQLDGRTVAVVGYGRIGRRVTELVRAFGARVLAVDPQAVSDGDVPVMTLDEALPLADIVTFHVSGEELVLGEREFGLLKAGAFVCIVARGGVVDEAALQRHLDSGQVGGAWLDCFVEEPYKGPLTGRPDVLLTPHVGSYTRECRLRMERDAATNLLAVLKGL